MAIVIPGHRNAPALAKAALDDGMSSSFGAPQGCCRLTSGTTLGLEPVTELRPEAGRARI